MIVVVIGIGTKLFVKLAEDGEGGGGCGVCANGHGQCAGQKGGALALQEEIRRVEIGQAAALRSSDVQPKGNGPVICGMRTGQHEPSAHERITAASEHQTEHASPRRSSWWTTPSRSQQRKKSRICHAPDVERQSCQTTLRSPPLVLFPWSCFCSLGCAASFLTLIFRDGLPGRLARARNHTPHNTHSAALPPADIPLAGPWCHFHRDCDEFCGSVFPAASRSPQHLHDSCSLHHSPFPRA